ncbi:hypothetical protein [Gordonia sp. NPDC003376]
MTTTEPHIVDLDAVRDQIDAIRAIDAQIKVLAETRASLRADVELALGDNEIGKLDGHTVATWKHTKRNSLDQTALKRAHPEIVAEFMRATEVRTFRVVE